MTLFGVVGSTLNFSAVVRAGTLAGFVVVLLP
jgi:hypothetical protein